MRRKRKQLQMSTGRREWSEPAVRKLGLETQSEKQTGDSTQEPGGKHPVAGAKSIARKQSQLSFTREVNNWARTLTNLLFSR